MESTFEAFKTEEQLVRASKPTMTPTNSTGSHVDHVFKAVI